MSDLSHPGLTAREGTWWQRRSLKLRLGFWFSLIAFVLLLALLPLIYTLTERRLNADLDPGVWPFSERFGGGVKAVLFKRPLSGPFALG